MDGIYMRKYTPEDDDYLWSVLSGEGWKDDQMTYKQDHTFICDNGFFSYRMNGDYPLLTHFYLDKNKRKGNHFRELVRDVWDIMTKEGHLFCVITAPKEKPYLEAFAKYYGKAEPYIEKEGTKYYLAPIFKRRRR